MNHPVVEIKNLSKSFKSGWKNFYAIKDLNLDIHRGETVVLTGPNGSGKSTLLKLIVGLLRPDKGCIMLSGKRAGTLEARAKIGFLPEHPAFPEFLTVGKILRDYGLLCGLNSHDRIQTIASSLNLDLDKKIKGFSKGMSQRLGIAQALLHDPEILILDEPTDGIDTDGVDQILQLLTDFKQREKTVILSSHIPDHFQKIIDRKVTFPT